MLRNAIFLLVVLLVSRLAQAAFSRKSRVCKTKPTSTIFVSLISYCDPNWPVQVNDILFNASDPDSVRVGVLEYVSDVSESRWVTGKWSANVRVHTVSSKIATSLRKARMSCVQALYEDEDFVVFTKAGHFASMWDAFLVANHIPKSVLTYNMKDVPTFPVVRMKKGDVVVKRKPLLSSALTRVVSSLLVDLEFMFVHKDDVRSVLHSSDRFDLSSHLKKIGMKIRVPAKAVVRRGIHPLGILHTTSNVASHEQGKLFFKAGEEGVLHASAHMGLVDDMDGEEVVAKYRSITEARIVRQSYEASSRQTKR